MIKLFKKNEKKYKRYSDYLKDHKEEIFESWLTPEFKKLYKCNVTKDIVTKDNTLEKWFVEQFDINNSTIEEIEKYISIAKTQFCIISRICVQYPDFIDEYRKKILKKDSMIKANAKYDFFLKHDIYKCESLKMMYYKVSHDLDDSIITPKSPLENIDDYKKFLNTVLNSIRMFFEYLILSLGTIATTTATMCINNNLMRELGYSKERREKAIAAVDGSPENN